MDGLEIHCRGGFCRPASSPRGRGTTDRCDARAGSCAALTRRGRCVEETGSRRNLPRVPGRKRDGAGRQGRHRQRAEGVGRSQVHHVFGIGEGCVVPAVRRQRDRDGLPGHARSDAADQQLRSRHRSERRQRRATPARRTTSGPAARRRWRPERSSAGHAAAGGCLAAVDGLARALPHAVGLPEGCGREQRDREPRRRGKSYTVADAGAPRSRRRPARATRSTAT